MVNPIRTKGAEIKKVLMGGKYLQFRIKKGDSA